MKKFIYGIFALGWRGSNRQWRHYEMAYLLLAGLSHAAGALGALGRVLRLRHVHPARLAHHDLPALLRRRRDLRRLRHGADDPAAGAPALSAARRPDHARSTWTRWRRSSCSPARSSATPTSWSCSSPGTARTNTRSFTFFDARIGMHGNGWYSWAYYCMMTCNVISPQIFWIKSMRHELRRRLHHLHVRQRRHVVRALRHHRHLARAGFPAVLVASLLALRGSRFGRSSAPSASSFRSSCSSCASCR